LALNSLLIFLSHLIIKVPRFGPAGCAEPAIVWYVTPCGLAGCLVRIISDKRIVSIFMFYPMRFEVMLWMLLNELGSVDCVHFCFFWVGGGGVEVFRESQVLL